VKNRLKTADIGFLKTELRKQSFRFLNFEVGSLRFLENRYPKFSSGSAHPYFLPSFTQWVKLTVPTLPLYDTATTQYYVYNNHVEGNLAPG